MKWILAKRRFLLAVAVSAVTSLHGCAPSGSAPSPIPEPAAAPLPVARDTARVPVEPPAEVAPPQPRFASWADSVLSTFSLEEKAAQTLMPWMLGDFAPEGSASFERIREMVEDLGVGGVIVSVGSPTEVALKVNLLQRRARVPLLIAADLERGAGTRFRGAAYLPGPIPLGGATEFPALMALGAAGDSALAVEVGRITAEEARAVGVHMLFAPVLDVNNNPENPIINVRSFGEDPMEVARLGAAFVEGVHRGGGLATAKHFPGHGDTDTDSHLALPVIPGSRERLDSVELVPFRAAVEAGVDAVMSAHISVPRLEGSDGLPATLSRAVLTGLLRDEMGFEGLAVTDAMDMYAIDRRFGREEAVVRALEAGADLILMPPDPRLAREAIAAAVQEGRLEEERLDEAVLRLLKMKEKLGLHEASEVPLDGVPHRVGIPGHQAVAETVAERSLTLLRNERNLLPLLGTRSARVLSVTYRSPSSLLAGRVLNSGLRARYPRLVTAEVDRDTPASVYETLLRRARRSNLVVVSLYVTAVSYSGSVAIPDEVAEFIEDLASRRIPHVVVSFGNPYLLADFPHAQAYLLAWSGVEASQRAVARALFGEIPIQGRTPTRLPPFFEIGDGIRLERREERR